MQNGDSRKENRQRHTRQEDKTEKEKKGNTFYKFPNKEVQKKELEKTELRSCCLHTSRDTSEEMTSEKDEWLFAKEN